MKAPGAPRPGYNHLAVRVGKKGDVEIIGFTNDEEKAAERSIRRQLKKLLPPEPNWIDIHLLSDLLKAIQFLTGTVKSSPTAPAYFTFHNGKRDCAILVSQIGVAAAPISKTTIPGIDQLPTGTFALSPENASALFVAAKANPSEKPVITKGTGKAVIDIIQKSGKQHYRLNWSHSHQIVIGQNTIDIFAQHKGTEGNRLNVVADDKEKFWVLDGETIACWLEEERAATGTYSVNISRGQLSFGSGGTLIKVGDAKRALTKLKNIGAEISVAIDRNHIRFLCGAYEIAIPAAQEKINAVGGVKISYVAMGFTNARWA